MGLLAVNTPQKSYTPYGGAADMWRCRDPHVLFDGPAGTGKTRAVLEKIHLAAMKYAGCRIILTRKTRRSLTESVLVIYEQEVLQDGFPKGRIHRTNRSSYDYPNGSAVVICGLEDPDRIRSAQYDLGVIFEATEATENDFEILDSRLRYNHMPYQQLICDCNPSYPGHWLKRRADASQITRIMSRHVDNPTVTPEYLERLGKLTGHRRARLLQGLWVAAEGLIYDMFDEALFVKQRQADWRRKIVGIDVGTEHPFSAHLYCVDGDGRVHVAEEFYRQHEAPSFCIQTMQRWTQDHDIEMFIVDPSAKGFRTEMLIAGLPTYPGDNAVSDGIRRCIDYLRIGLDGEPRLTVDPSCINFLNEILSYRWRENTDGTRKDEPEKKDDHAMDDWRYATAYIEATSGDMEVHRV